VDQSFIAGAGQGVEGVGDERSAAMGAEELAAAESAGLAGGEEEGVQSGFVRHT
jgi:hypothetical protein